ncbi:tetratricopeptide repeat protein [Flavobacterium sp.]|uniref:tetratricopeptide repeat protein n=1 Tax=Flavobacterium sp. TaxID=239 RepID=UPI002637E4DC|nr:tetratricopeptide repeat protein [Flavobacterium sp.]
MNEEVYISFESYLNNEMSQAEKELFEQRLNSDNQFRESFNLYKETTAMLENKFDSKTIDFKENLKSISKTHFSENKEDKSRVINFKPFYYAIAASVVLAFGTWFMMQGNPEYGDFNQHENAYFTERGSIIKNLRLAQNAFNEKNYKVAIENFQIVLKDYDKPEVRFFYGISLLEENRYSEAKTNFTTIQNGTSVYKDKATWYLALSKLKQNQFDECKDYIKQIPEDAEDYEKAQKLLNKLD